MELIDHIMVHYARLRIQSYVKEAIALEGRHFPSNIYVRGIMTNPGSLFPHLPPMAFPLKEIWITILPYHDHSYETHILYYPTFLNRFIYKFPFLHLNHPPQERIRPLVEIQVDTVVTRVDDEGRPMTPPPIPEYEESPFS